MKKILILVIVAFIFKGCLDLRPCPNSIEGKYQCDNNKNSINYLCLKEDGNFLHYYKEGKVELSHTGTWKKNEDGYCYIELRGWRNYNEKGIHFNVYMKGILYISGNYLDISPDGESSTSFKKE